ncbi:hypothetical protein CZ787_00015 [Halomonas citrativorans]|uniref:Uncharacterized protein n=1 Tax=Halomonas citrativorans TaxID=2742612 RepID=A0A1R4HML7_9GAMM|nr:hypothetical protein CZ787_00015 [Halomonas citrativorans]
MQLLSEQQNNHHGVGGGAPWCFAISSLIISTLEVKPLHGRMLNFMKKLLAHCPLDQMAFPVSLKFVFSTSGRHG